MTAQVQARTLGPEQAKPAFPFRHPTGHAAFLTTMGLHLPISCLGLHSIAAMALCCLPPRQAHLHGKHACSLLTSWPNDRPSWTPPTDVTHQTREPSPPRRYTTTQHQRFRLLSRLVHDPTPSHPRAPLAQLLHLSPRRTSLSSMLLPYVTQRPCATLGVQVEPPTLPGEVTSPSYSDQLPTCSEVQLHVFNHSRQLPVIAL